MTANKYARKAARFTISNPAMPASEGQLRQIGRLIRFKATTVEYGNYIVEALELPMTRAEADREIKKLAALPNRSAQSGQTVQTVVTVVKATEKAVQPVSCTNEDLGKLALSGKLGKVAQNRALALVA